MSGTLAYGCYKLGSDEKRQAAGRWRDVTGGERQRILLIPFKQGELEFQT